jgi:hypothetical protein
MAMLSVSTRKHDLEAGSASKTLQAMNLELSQDRFYRSGSLFETGNIFSLVIEVSRQSFFSIPCHYVDKQ